MADYDGTAMRYVDRMLGKTDKPALRGNPGPGHSQGRMFERGNSIFSYGSHFTIAIWIPATKTQEGFFLINGDTWGPTTGKQQRCVRNAIARSGAKSVIIPFRALDAAGIDQDSIRLLEVTADWNERVTVTQHTFPEGAVWNDDEIVDSYGEGMYLDGHGEPWVDRFRNTAHLPWEIKWPNWSERGMQGRLMDALFEGDRKRRGYHHGYYGRTSHTEPVLYISKRAVTNGWPREHMRWSISRDDAGRETFTRSYDRHWLGESLISAEVTFMGDVKCEECNGSGQANESWIDDWQLIRYDSAMNIRKHWERDHVQDDLDRIARNIERRIAGFPIPAWAKEPRPEPEVPTYPAWQTVCRVCRGSKKNRVQKRRRATFLSGFDMNEARPSYFFCELPKSKATTVAEAYQVLKPEAVRLAESLGRTVSRQGDIYAIPTEYTKRELTKRGAVFTRKGYVLGTNHQATEVAILPDGTTLGRGTLVHAPEGRRPDHRRIPLGKQFTLIMKNEVPVSR